MEVTGILFGLYEQGELEASFGGWSEWTLGSSSFGLVSGRRSLGIILYIIIVGWKAAVS